MLCADYSWASATTSVLASPLSSWTLHEQQCGSSSSGLAHDACPSGQCASCRAHAFLWWRLPAAASGSICRCSATGRGNHNCFTRTNAVAVWANVCVSLIMAFIQKAGECNLARASQELGSSNGSFILSGVAWLYQLLCQTFRGAYLTAERPGLHSLWVTMGTYYRGPSLQSTL